MVKRSLHTGIKNPVNGNKIVVYNPMGRERSIDATKTIKIQIDKTIFRLSIDEKEKALKIRKMGPGTVRGGMDRITITPQEAYEFLIR